MSTIAYRYRAMARDGGKRRGVTTAPTKVEAFRQISSMGLTPVSIKPIGRGLTMLRVGRVKKRDIADMTYQLSVLFDSRIPLSDGLQTIAAQEPNPRLRSVITDVASRIEAGESIAGAMAQHVGIFGDVYVENIRAAERTGTMSVVLQHLSEMLERAQETSSQIRSALMYPVIVVTTLAGAVSFLVTFVIPRFARMFAERDVELPAMTQLLMHVGEGARAYWWIVLGCAVGAAFILGRTWRSPHGRLLIDHVLHRVPFLRRLLVGLAISRFVRVLGVSLSSGLNLIECLDLAGRASGRPTLAREAELMADQVRAGGRLSEVLLACRYLTPFARRMLSAGEESGELARMCALVARHYDRETLHLSRNIATIIEPLLVLLIAGVVLAVALAIFLPLWNMVALLG